MIFSYIKSAHRSVIRNKLQSAIQISSLAMGITVFFLISLYIYDEVTVDRQDPDHSEVFRVEFISPYMNDDVVPLPLKPIVLDHIPEIQASTRIFFQSDVPVACLGERDGQAISIELENHMVVDTGFFDVFPFEFIHGDQATCLSEPLSVVLTESVSKSLFPKESPLGKTIYMWNFNPTRVTGVIRDPENTHLNFEALVPMSTWMAGREKRGHPTSPSETIFLTHPCYIRLHHGVDVEQVEEKISRTWRDFIPTVHIYNEDMAAPTHLRPLREVHFADIDPTQGYMDSVDKKKLLGFFFLGLGILLLGIINYVNMSTARASMRSREMAIRKISGSTGQNLIFYILIESVVTTLFAFLVAMTLTQLLFPTFNYLLSADINLYFLRSPLAWLILLLFIVTLGLVSGIYPAIAMARDLPLDTLSGQSRSKGKGLLTRRILTVAQFASAVILLLGILTMHRQISYMHNRDPGFDTEQVVQMGTGSHNTQDRQEMKRKLELIPEIRFIGFSMPLIGWNKTDDVPLVDDPGSLFYGLELKIAWADLDFFQVYDLKFTHGADILEQNFFRNLGSDSTDEIYNYIVINETCRQALGLEDPLGITTKEGGDGSVIVGVIEDFHFQSMVHPVKPMAIFLMPTGQPWGLSIKAKTSDMDALLEEIAQVMTSITIADEIRQDHLGIPRNPFRYSFADDSFKMQYAEVERIRSASAFLAILAVIIACLGLFGLSTFMAQRRVKEIGIRRALGASEKLVFVLLAREFVKWVGISLLIGLPAGWLIMDVWQQQFAYRAGTAWWTYMLTIVLVLLTSLGTVSWQAVKAARSNPVDSLRTE